MKRSEKFDEVTAALFKAKALIAALPLVKDKQGDKAKYLQLSTLLAAIEPILLANDLLLVQGTTDDAIQDGVISAMRIETTLLHVSGQWISNNVLIPVAGAQKKAADGGGFYPPSQQSGGVTITYGRRYGIFAMFSLAIDEDTDGASRNQQRRSRAKGIAEEVATRTEERLAAMRDKLNTDKVVCACGAKLGQKHKAGCTKGTPGTKVTSDGS